jgi:hypothetical protein
MFVLYKTSLFLDFFNIKIQRKKDGGTILKTGLDRHNFLYFYVVCTPDFNKDRMNYFRVTQYRSFLSFTHVGVGRKSGREGEMLH